jgi:outer membrane protein insertion porin family
MIKKTTLILSLLLLFFVDAFSQDTIVNPDIYYSTPVKYEIGGVEIEGIKYLDEEVLIQLSGLTVGKMVTIPGDDVTKGIKKLYKQGLFSDIKIIATKVVGNKIFLKIFLQERS